MFMAILFPIFLLTSTFTTKQVCDKCGYFGGSFELGGFTNNDMPVFTDISTPQDRKSKGFMKVNITNSIFGILDLNIGMQGFIGQNNFNQGHGGGIWGADLWVANNVSIGYQHYSCHAFNTDIPQNNCGSMDYFGVKFSFGYNDINKNRSSLLQKIIGK